MATHYINESGISVRGCTVSGSKLHPLFLLFAGDGAGSGIRTRVSSLEGWRINPYTIPAKNG